MTDKDNCEEARDRSEAEGGNGSYGCITLMSPPQGKKAAENMRAQAADVPLPANECTGDEDGSWYATRTMQCQIDPNVKYTYFDSDGKIAGTALFATAQQMNLSTTSLQWSETDQLVMLKSTGDLPPLTITWTTKCAPTCSTGSTTLWTKQPISVGQRLEKTYTISDTPTTTYDYLDVTYELDIDAPNADQLTPPISWDSEVRCDDKLSIANTSGCVVPWTTPTLFVSRAEYGSSADMIEWAQQNLSGHWGLKGTGAPLHRLQNVKQRDANRQALCGSSKFAKDPAITDDSCDEFPFAGTYESGALNGVDHGKDCAQVTAVRADTTGDNATDWPTITPLGPFTGEEKCVRGHIPGSLNSYLGGAYGNFIQSARLADNDGFWLRVTF